ncbi:MAG: hypothetical protein LCH54_12905 [Bacteroidetes bacterium]|nr:hypothetical protein [Bacteroidota bacterium]
MELEKLGKLLRAFAWILAVFGVIVALLSGSFTGDWMVLLGGAIVLAITGTGLILKYKSVFWASLGITLAMTLLLGWRTTTTFIHLRSLAKTNQMADFPSIGVEALIFGILTIASLLVWMVSLSLIRSFLNENK